MIAPPLAPAAIVGRAHAARKWPFGFGWRFFVLLAAGAVLAIPAWIDRRAVVAMLAWDVLLLLAWWVDLRRIRAAALEVRRSWEGPVALGVASEVTIGVVNDGPVGLHVVLTDDVPGDLRRALPVVHVNVPAGAAGPGFAGAVEATYEATPAHRGDVDVGPISLRCQTAWAIAEWWLVAPLEQRVRVYPNLYESRRQAMFLVRSRQVALEKRRARVSPLGRDFESLRDYHVGDDVRDVCWTATARRAKPVTKVYQPERSQVVWILVDGGRLLRARTATRMKLDATVDAALALAEVALAAGDRVGLVTYGRTVHRRLAPDRGHRHLRAVLDALATVPAERAEADHAGAAAAIMAVQKQRALIVWLTDLSETAGIPDVVENAARLSPHHIVVFALMRHSELTAVGAAPPETEDEMYRGLAAQETLDRREVLLHGLQRQGVLVVDLAQDTPAAALIDQYLRVKDRNLV
jgi:uncharacterized protein (DUF58 family)